MSCDYHLKGGVGAAERVGLSESQLRGTWARPGRARCPKCQAWVGTRACANCARLASMGVGIVPAMQEAGAQMVNLGYDVLNNPAVAGMLGRYASVVTRQDQQVNLIPGGVHGPDGTYYQFATNMEGEIEVDPRPLGQNAPVADQIVGMWGGLEHELAHNLYSPSWLIPLINEVRNGQGIGASMSGEGRGLFGDVCNILEDGRVERLLRDQVPGAYRRIEGWSLLQERWDEQGGDSTPIVHQVLGACLYEGLPAFSVRPEVYEGLNPEARRLFDLLRPIVRRGVHGNARECLQAAVDVVRTLEREGALGQPVPPLDNIQSPPFQGSETADDQARPNPPPQQAGERAPKGKERCPQCGAYMPVGGPCSNCGGAGSGKDDEEGGQQAGGGSAGGAEGEGEGGEGEQAPGQGTRQQGGRQQPGSGSAGGEEGEGEGEGGEGEQAPGQGTGQQGDRQQPGSGSAGGEEGEGEGGQAPGQGTGQQGGKQQPGSGSAGGKETAPAPTGVGGSGAGGGWSEFDTNLIEETPPDPNTLEALRQEAERAYAEAVAGYVAETAQRDAQRIADGKTGWVRVRDSKGSVNNLEIVAARRDGDPVALQRIEKARTEYRGAARRFARELNAIQSDVEADQPFQRQGELDRRRMVAAVKGDDRVRIRRGEEQALDIAVSIEVDRSGSMVRETFGVLIRPATDACAVTAMALEEARIPYEVRSFGFGDTFGADPHPKHYIHKAFSDDKTEPAALASMYTCGGSTPTHEALDITRAALQTRPEGVRLAFILTDGIPDVTVPTKEAVQAMRKQGITPIVLLVAKVLDDDKKTDMNIIFGRGGWEHITSPTFLYQAVTSRVREIMVNAEKER